MRRFSSLMCAGLVLVLVLSLFGGALAAPAGDRVEVLIGFHGRPNPGLIRAFGGEVLYEFSLIPTIHAMLPAQAAAALGRHPSVRYMEPNGEVWAVAQETPWGVEKVGAPVAWSESTGAGVGVAVLDTGIHRDHPDLVGQVAGGVTTIDGTAWYSDKNGHGTHVAGTIAAVNNTIGVVGVAHRATLYGVKVLNDRGSGTWTSVARGIEWVVDQGNIRVINMSLSGSASSSTLEDACAAADEAGVLLVAAAGNNGNAAEGSSTVGYPAKYETVIAVAASDIYNNLASFSSTGPEIELIAPGVAVKSTVPRNSYATYSGTSMASPHVAGVAALVWGKNPGLPNTDVRELLIQTAEDLRLSVEHQGRGLVRADLAVTATSGTTPVGELGTISGNVVDSNQAEIDGATVTITELRRSTTTENGGNYSFDDVPVGTYTMTAAAAGYETATMIDIEVGPDQSTEQDFILQPKLTGAQTVRVDAVTYSTTGGRSNDRHLHVAITLKDGAGDPVAGASVSIDLYRGGSMYVTSTGTTGSTGTVTFSYNNAPSGTYTTTVTAVTAYGLEWDGVSPEDTEFDKK